MKKKLLVILNKMQAINLIVRSDQWFVSAVDAKNDKTLVINSDMPAKALRTTISYIDVAIMQADKK